MVRTVPKDADLFAGEPAHAERMLVDGGFTLRYHHIQRARKELPSDKWREYDAEDTVRFYVLRLHELGFVKSSLQKIVADGTDWLF